jgi:hypothetical protein
MGRNNKMEKLKEVIYGLSVDSKILLLEQWTIGDIDLIRDWMEIEFDCPETPGAKELMEALKDFTFDELVLTLENLLGKETNGLLTKLGV